jgi:hypothetical protein
MTPEEQAKAHDRALRTKAKGLFSDIPEVKADAVDALKESWGFDEPSFRVEELAAHPSQNCAIMAARRDGHKEILSWLTKL